MSAIAIIPARGGSKRIPRKNILPFHGLPMVAHSIRAALDCGLFQRVIVSTDDEEIAAIARQHGAELPFLRPAALANDHATTLAVIQHALQALAAQGESYDYACCLYATAPFVQVRYLRAGWQALNERPDKSYAFSVAAFGFPVQRALRINADGSLAAMYPQYRDTRSQDLEEGLQDAGQFYWGRSAAWLAGEPLFSPASLPVRLPRHLVQDIDTPEDWQRAEWLYGALKAAGELA